MSVSGELISFILPNFADPMQVGFLGIILSMMGYTIVSAHLAARPTSWERKWTRGTARTDDDLDIEHGSVTDLWHAVATSSEKLAEVMPGMLLVVGLLGTFLGLGMALNHASSILSQSDAIVDGMDDLLAMLQGLGTKFKTSTWGIMGFVALKIWSEVTRFEEKRLAWVIDKVKVELEQRKKVQVEADESKQRALLETIKCASDGIVEAITSALNKSDITQVGALGQVKGALVSLLDQGSENQLLRTTQLRAVGNQICEEIRFVSDKSYLEQQRLFQISHEKLTLIQNASSASSNAMDGFTRGTMEIVRQMASAAQEMVAGSRDVSSAATGLKEVVDAFGAAFKDVLDEVRHDLSGAIQRMSEDSASTLKEGSGKLEGATLQISDALKTLSGDVTETMSMVQGSIEKALDIQRKSALEFTVSSETLNKNIQVTTGNAERLGKTIEESLGSVADAGKKMDRIGRHLDDVVLKTGLTAVIPDITQLLRSIEKLMHEQVGVLGLLADGSAARSSVVATTSSQSSSSTT